MTSKLYSWPEVTCPGCFRKEEMKGTLNFTCAVGGWISGREWIEERRSDVLNLILEVEICLWWWRWGAGVAYV
jgi:hypothetical protein